MSNWVFKIVHKDSPLINIFFEDTVLAFGKGKNYGKVEDAYFTWKWVESTEAVTIDGEDLEPEQVPTYVKYGLDYYKGD